MSLERQSAHARPGVPMPASCSVFLSEGLTGPSAAQRCRCQHAWPGSAPGLDPAAVLVPNMHGTHKLPARLAALQAGQLS